MNYEIKQDGLHPDDWRVEAVDPESEGQCYVTIFSGWKAGERAREYAEWKTEQAQEGRDRQYLTSAAMSSTHV